MELEVPATHAGRATLASRITNQERSIKNIEVQLAVRRAQLAYLDELLAGEAEE